MKAQSLLQSELPLYQQMILEVTHAPVADLAILENIMRDQVFHSTLDWQTKKEFAEGAREAYTIFLEDQRFYRRMARAQSLRWQICQWENELHKSRKRRNSKAIERLITQLDLARKDLEALESPGIQASPNNHA